MVHLVMVPIDLNQSLSRVMNSIITDEHRKKSELIKKYFSIYQEFFQWILTKFLGEVECRSSTVSREFQYFTTTHIYAV